MDRLKFCTPEDRLAVIQELRNIGCCELCVLRYLGVVESAVYKNEKLAKEVLGKDIVEKTAGESGDVNGDHSSSKLKKRNPCTACLGLLEDGIQEPWIDKIADAIKKSEIESLSYCPAISLPIAVQIRAYSIWFHLKNKFAHVFSTLEDLKPDGTAIKSVWKWICSDKLRHIVNPDSEWTITGTTAVQIAAAYKEEHEDCRQLHDYLQNVKKIKKKQGGELVTRGTVESTFQNMTCDEFNKTFTCPPSIPTETLKFKSCDCFHSPILIAGRYCKYSRKLSQTPWVLDGVRKTETSVEELITDQVIPFLRAEESKFLSSGREDVDVRTLGRGRPFACEIINPKRTIFTVERMKELEEKINESTELISVNSIQIVDKKELFILKHGEESKTKSYCALCSTLGTPVTPAMMEILNNQAMPLVLIQRTPIRVLHRRTSSDRPRSILSMKATIVPNHTDIFTLHITTEAGTYVKEFVHGDFGRTVPNVSQLLGVEADICALDVDEVNLDWPPVAPTKDLKNDVEMKEPQIP